MKTTLRTERRSEKSVMNVAKKEMNINIADNWKLCRPTRLGSLISLLTAAWLKAGAVEISAYFCR